MPTLTTLLVGSHFRPPAKVILENIPAGTPLSFEPEPENPYDSAAVKVLLTPTDIPERCHERLGAAMEGFGADLAEVLEGPPVFLGYVAKSGGKPLQGTDYVGNQEIGTALADFGETWTDLTGTLGFSPTGAPTVEIKL